MAECKLLAENMHQVVDMITEKYAIVLAKELEV